MPDNVLPAAGAVVALERIGNTTPPSAADVLYLGKFGWGTFGTFNPIVRDGAGGLPIQFDNVTGTVFGAPNEVPAASENATAGLIPLLKALLRDFRARTPALGQANMAASVPVVLASNQSALTIGGNVDLRVGGAAAAGGAGLTNANTLRVVAASDQPVPTGARTTVECNQATGIRAAYTTSSAAFALPALGASRAIRIDCTKGLLFEFGADSSVTVADDANAYRMFDNDRDYPVVPVGMTHIAIMGIEAGTAYIKAVNG